MSFLPFEYIPRTLVTLLVLLLSYVVPLVLFQYVNKIMPLKNHHQIKAKFMMKMARYMFLLKANVTPLTVFSSRTGTVAQSGSKETEKA